MYKIKDEARSFGLSDQIYETLEQAKLAAMLRAAQIGSSVQVIACSDLDVGGQYVKNC
jgi:adenylate kinase|tara:strand:+ start:537 stop:710 length:174 start_codon:yes stop_codon:yes gene_type:complete